MPCAKYVLLSFAPHVVLPLADASSPQLAADTELSVKNGAELLDRLVKDIVSESAASYVSILHPDDPDATEDPLDDPPTAFSLPKFIPLLQERIYVINPFTRTFLVSWITLLDSIPDLELVAYLPSFLDGLLKFLTDSNADVHTMTKACLDRFLQEIKKIAGIKRHIADSRRSQAESGRKLSFSTLRTDEEQKSDDADGGQSLSEQDIPAGEDDTASSVSGSLSSTALDNKEDAGEEWIPGQDVIVDHAKILHILLDFLQDSSGWFQPFLAKLFLHTPPQHH